jgi:adenine-specific DNA glycosylase
MVSKTREDLPEPETPVTTVRRLCGISSEMFLRLWTRAPRILCLPRRPRCEVCPLTRYCEARRRGIEDELPVKEPRGASRRIDKTLLVIFRNGRLLLRRRPDGDRRLGGFWELPELEQVPGVRLAGARGVVQHSITNHHYRLKVVAAAAARAPRGFRWVSQAQLERLPLTTASRKALRLYFAGESH